MTIVFRVAFDGEVQEIDATSDGRYLISTIENNVLDLLDIEDRSSTETRCASTFERALSLMEGWMQGTPVLVDDEVADNVSALLLAHQGRMSNGWRQWLRTGSIPPA